MVRALLAGTKTQTRRIVKPQPEIFPDNEEYARMKGYIGATDFIIKYLAPKILCPYGKNGDFLWVREAWAEGTDGHEKWPIYKASFPAVSSVPKKDQKWSQAMFMPRWASRITIELVAVRIEPLQEISEKDAKAEGAPADIEHSHDVYDGVRDQFQYVKSYQRIWESLHGEDSWAFNPWVWVLEFKVHQQNIDQLIRSRAA